ncbi:murein DD-endopeptidase MepM/ murein hydrolase activator NlpD [Microbacterium resistens]|uniref:Murein DD-endopeptidase MepM/ murein hydrolase activator NlpD n=1 Tax=Microbacterium resistens TaxID=156977 RepID=A0ABU1S9P4_9MICO|nr:VCBS repeat domain-containing M23 family metallopeptidase [Microbacterium resistens]MDR6866316.1 murein DD-endopeptidase MepM/ murein hydrolase activator NlpD [Microbacterium resistens]
MPSYRHRRRWRLGLVAGLTVALGATLSLGAAPTTAEAAYGSMIQPVTGWVSSVVGNRCPGADGHQGIDITGGSIHGAPIKAAYGGTVTIAGWYSGYGNAVEIVHPAGYETLYGHMVSAPNVSIGDTVGKGSVIGNVGNTGQSFGSHLHFEVHRYGENIAASLGYSCGLNVSQGAGIPYSFPGLGTVPFDVDQDGNSDLLAVRNDGYLAAFLGDGASFSGHLLGQGWDTTTMLAHGDYTSDGADDVVQIRSDGSYHFYEGNGGGTFTHRVTGSGWAGYGLLTGGSDFSGDGKADLVARATDGNLYLYPGNGQGGFQSPQLLSMNWTGINALIAGDFDQDGRGDLIGRASNGSLYLYRGSGPGALGAPTVLGPGWSGFTVIGGGDYNGDGRADLIGRRMSDQTLWLYPGNGAGAFGSPTQIGSGWGAFVLIV